MRVIHRNILLFLVVLATAIGCGGGGGASSSPQTPPTPPVVVNIYAIGDANPDLGLPHVSAYKVWKNGVEILAMPANSDPYAMTVSGSDVYVAGGLFNPTTGSTTHTVWKNGVTTSALAPTANQIIIGLAAFGNDIYAIGDANPNLGLPHVSAYKVWRNGVEVLAMPAYSDPYAFTVSGSDVYVAGGLFNPTTGSTTHTVWKNGVTTSALAPTANQIIIGLAAFGNDIYAIGDTNPNLGLPHVSAYKVWKNGVEVLAMPAYCDPYAITVSGSDIYVAGGLFNPTTGSTIHTVWKNGVTTSALAPTANQIIIRLANSSK